MASPTVEYLIRAQDQTAQAFRSVDTRISRITRSFKTLAGFAGFAALGATLTRAASAAIEFGGALEDSADKFGVSVGVIQTLNLAAKDAGTTFETLESALGFLTRQTAAATTGNKKAAEAFRALGVDAAKLAQLPLDDQLGIIADQLRQIENPSERLALQFQILGRSSAELSPLLKKGSDGLRDIEGQLKSVNAVLRDDQAAALGRAGDYWDLFTRGVLANVAQVTAVAVQLGEDLYEGLTRAGPPPRFVRPTSSFGGINFGGLPSMGANLPPSLPSDPAGPRVGNPTALREVEKAAKGAGKALKEVEDKFTTITEFLAGEASKKYADDQASVLRVIEQTRTPFEQYAEQLAEIDRLQREAGLSAETAGRATIQAGKDYAEAQKELAGVNDKLKDTNTELLDSIRTAAEGFANELTDVFFEATGDIGDMFENLAKTIAKALFYQAVSAPLIDSILGAFKIPGRAMGGPVAAGSPYMVGERGPELFVPRQSGQIVPNGAMGGQQVNVTFNVNSLDPGTAAAVIQSNRAQIVGMIRGAVQRTGRRPAMA
jgi:hypothetical protein